MRAWLFGLLAILYLLGFPYHPRLRSPNELCRLWQARALVDFHTLELNGALRAYGRVGDLSFFQGRFYPSKAPLLSFAAAPIYLGLRALHGGNGAAVPETELVYCARMVLTVLPTLLLLLLLSRFLSTHVSASVANALVVTYALGSLAFSYSLLFMSHQPTAALVFTLAFILWRCARGQWPRWAYAVAGTCAGAALATEYTAALPVLLVSLYGLYTCGTGELLPWAQARARLQGAILYGLGAAPWAVALMVYHQVCFGGPFESGYKHLADAAYQPWHQGGFLGIGLPDVRALFFSFFSPLRGLFALSPFLVLGLLGLPRLYRRDAPLFWLTAALLAGYTYFTSSFSYASWGWTTGPRHLTPLVPFLLAPAALLLESWRRRGYVLGVRLAAGLCMASILVTGVLTGLNYIPDDVSNGVGALAIPLFRDGFFPPTALALASPAAWPGAFWLGGVVLGAALAGGLLVPRGVVTLSARAALPAVLAAQALVILLTTRGDAADRQALALLESSWLVRPTANAPAASVRAVPSGRPPFGEGSPAPAPHE